MQKDKIKNFLKDRYNQILILIIIFAAVIRIKYLFIDQAEWWDAADYLTFAKIIGGKLVHYVGYDFNPRRPFLLAVLWGALYRVGANEVVLRFTEFLFSMGIVLLTYLIGKELYNKTVGLIASAIISGFYLILFYTMRLMTDVPAVFFLMLTIYMFWKGFVKNEGKKYMILTGVFAGLAVLTRSASIYTFPFLFLFIFIIQRFKILKNKYFWLTIILGLIVFSPFLIFVHFKHGGDAIGKFLGTSTGRFTQLSESPIKFDVLFDHLMAMPVYFDADNQLSAMIAQKVVWENLTIGIILKNIFLILFVVGFFYLLIELFLGLDILIKNKSENLRSNLFILLWFLIPFLGFSFTTGFEDRYIMVVFPAAFILISLILIKLYDFITKYNKVIAVIIVGSILLFGIYNQTTYGFNLIKSKQMSYYPVKQAGLWIKDHSFVGDKIISASSYQNMYYSERDTFEFENERLKYMGEEAFDKYARQIKPKYLVISVFEPAFTPEWAYSYPNKHNLKPVQAYYMNNNDKYPALIIYEFNSY